MKKEHIIELIETNHKKCRQATKDKLYKKIMAIRNRWKIRYDIKKSIIDVMLSEWIGKACKYCG